MGRSLRSLLIVVSLALSITVFAPVVCHAAIGPYVMGYAADVTFSRYLSGGTFAREYLYTKPSLSSGQEYVSSIYAETHAGSGMEVGYYYDTASSSPHWFYLFMDVQGVPHPDFNGQPISVSMTVPSYVQLHLKNRQGTDDWDIYVTADGQTAVKRATYPDTGMQSSYAKVARERSCSFGYATWRSLQYIDWYGKFWVYWSYVRYADASYDNDTTYDLKFDQLQGSNHQLTVNTPSVRP